MPPSSTVTRVAGGGAIVLHLLVAWPVAFTGLLAPPAAVVGLGLVWVAGAALVLWWWRRRPWRALAVPPLVFGVWVVVLNLGDLFLGWTA